MNHDELIRVGEEVWKQLDDTTAKRIVFKLCTALRESVAREEKLLGALDRAVDCLELIKPCAKHFEIQEYGRSYSISEVADGGLECIADALKEEPSK